MPLFPLRLIARVARLHARRRVSKGMVFMLVAVWSAKGGSGTSVVAAALALCGAARGHETRLVDFGGDQPGILGCPPLTSFTTLVDWVAAGASAPTEWLDEMALPVAPGLYLLPGGAAAAAPPETGAALAVALRDSGLVVVDVGSGAGRDGTAGRAVIDVADAALVVIRPCYLALRAAVADPRLGLSAGVIVVEEPGRALDADDVGAVLGLPVIARLPCRAEIARAVDAGVLRDHLPAPLARGAGSVLDRLADLADGRWAA